jgi:hypothetical protein
MTSTLLTNLVAGWKLDGNSNDVLGVHNGTDTAITYSSANGILGEGAGFNGSTSKIEVGAVTFGTVMSLSFWLKGTPNPSSFFLDSTGSRVFLWFGTNQISGYSWGGATTGGIAITFGSGWNHFVFVGNGTTMQLYQNGVAIGSPIAFVPTSITTTILKIGSRYTDDFELNIPADEIYLWNKALSLSEVAELYNGGLANTWPFSNGIQIDIDGVDKTDTVDWRSVRKSEVLSKESDNLEFRIKNYGTKTYQPSLGESVVMSNEGTKIFGGVIVEMREQMDGLAKFIQVVCKDYSELLDQQLVSKTYQNMTVNAIIADLISSFSTGFTVTNVACPVMIDNVVFNYLTISKCLQKLTDVLGTYEWYVDYDKDIHFFLSTSVLSPFNLTDTSANFVYKSLTLKKDTSQIRNEIILRGGEITAETTRTEYTDGDGTKVQWPLANKFASIPTVVVNGVTKTVGVDFLNEDTDFQCMWDYNSQSLRFTAGNTPIAGTRNVAVTGYPQYPLIVIKRNEASIALYGVHQYIITDKTIKTLDSASARADAEVARYANPTESGQFITYVDGLKAGQYININSTIRGVNQSFKIRSITTTLYTPTTFAYNVNIETSNDIGINDVLSKLLITNPADQITVGASEVVQRFYGFDESATISDTLSAPTHTSPPYLWGTGTWGFSTWG